jgi:hypothetical protein
MNEVSVRFCGTLTSTCFGPNGEEEPEEKDEEEKDRAGRLSRSKGILDYAEAILAVDPRRRNREDFR